MRKGINSSRQFMKTRNNFDFGGDCLGDLKQEGRKFLKKYSNKISRQRIKDSINKNRYNIKE